MEESDKLTPRSVLMRRAFNLEDKTDPRIDALCEAINDLNTKGTRISIDLKGIDLCRANFEFRGRSPFSHYTPPDGWRLILDGINLAEANLSEANLIGADLTGCNLHGANLNCAKLNDASLICCDLSDAILFGAELNAAKLDSTDFRHAYLQWAQLRNASLKNAGLRFTNLNGADISGTNFEEADIFQASFVDVTVDQRTVFTNVREPFGCKITRLTLDSLKDYGGLTVGNLAKMKVIDDVARLRQTFGGPWFWTHVCLVICFFLPYARFVLERLVREYFSHPSVAKISLGRSLWNFIQSGGTTWVNPQLKLLPFGCFVLFSLYNVLRITLLWKTARLETDQFVTKIPSDFSLDTSPGWKFAFDAVNWLKYLAILVAVIHTVHFLSVTQVPLAP